MIRAQTQRFRDDQAGVTVIEFAMIAPAMILVLLGVFEAGFNMYVNSVLQGAVERAGRDSSLETADRSNIDQIVSNQVRTVIPSATIGFERMSYENFSDVWRPEEYNDLNSDGQCNDGEPFEDANYNGVWDNDRGAAGGGGASDAVVYTVTVSYDRMFPLANMIGLSDQHIMEANTVLRNQPFELLESKPVTENCI